MADGSSDLAMLKPLLEWLVRHELKREIVVNCPEFGRMPRPPRTLADKIRKGMERCEVDILFVHRDAERQDPSRRDEEIEVAIGSVACCPVHVAVVPVRMSEAWLLLDERAIRATAWNPRGTAPLGIPDPSRIESVDAKAVLQNALVTANGSKGRSLEQFERHIQERITQVAAQIADHAEGWLPSYRLPSFLRLAERIRALELPN
ncbi:MAG TPA: hypothetical protein PKO15_11145 [Fibrobacteria bacterium]|nr:hypothetical protein [Fibrobacteria bacterium]